jgi:hypothetical protein
MSTLATTNIQHPDSPTPQIAMTSNSMTFDATNLTFSGDSLDLPANTTLDGGPLVDQQAIINTAVFANLFLMGG